MTSGAGYHAAKLNQPAHKLKLICFGDMMPPGGSLLLDAVRERRKSDLSSWSQGPATNSSRVEWYLLGLSAASYAIAATAGYGGRQTNRFASPEFRSLLARRPEYCIAPLIHSSVLPWELPVCGPQPPGEMAQQSDRTFGGSRDSAII